MLRLFGLFVCVSLAFVFPLYAYETNIAVVSDAIISTSVFSVIIIALFRESNSNKKIEKNIEDKIELFFEYNDDLSKRFLTIKNLKN